MWVVAVVSQCGQAPGRHQATTDLVFQYFTSNQSKWKDVVIRRRREGEISCRMFHLDLAITPGMLQ